MRRETIPTVISLLKEKNPTNKWQFFEYLYKKTIDTTSCDIEGFNILSYAVFHKKYKIISFLLEKENFCFSSVNLNTDKKKTNDLVSYAIECGNIYLLKKTLINYKQNFEFMR